MDCETLAAHLTDFLDGHLDPTVEAEAVDHLAACTQCETVLAETKTIIGLARRHGRISLTAVERTELLKRILADS
jgi:anti-sigma factor RsiW